ncbi:MAG: hypothetical protein ACQET8_23080 [Bacillota bacterium]
MEYTTGQVIDHLYEKGGKFIDQDGNEIEWSSGDMRIKSSKSGVTIELNRTLRNSIWSKVPEYVGFEVAMKALKQKKTVYYYASWSNVVMKVTPEQFTEYALPFLEVKNEGLENLIDGRWSIEE